MNCFLSLPAQSPDLNHIKHMRETAKHNITYKTKLKEKIVREWSQIPPEVMKKLVDSMTRHLAVVRQNKYCAENKMIYVIAYERSGQIITLIQIFSLFIWSLLTRCLIQFEILHVFRRDIRLQNGIKIIYYISAYHIQFLHWMCLSALPK